jgi:hypothetical protein
VVVVESIIPRDPDDEVEGASTLGKYDSLRLLLDLETLFVEPADEEFEESKAKGLNYRIRAANVDCFF